MTIFTSRGASALALAAALAMTATPAMARGSGGGWGGGWGGGGWGNGWGGGHHRRHDRIDTGDVLAGVLIIGGIAAIASAASKSSKARRDADYRYPERDRYPDRDGRESSGGYGDRSDDRSQPGSSRSPTGLSDAVDTCVGEVERGDRRVDTVDSAGRDGDGWRVEGQVSNGRSFACTVDRDGRIRTATVDGRAL